MGDLKMKAPLVSQWKHCRLKHDKRVFFILPREKTKTKTKTKTKHTSKQTNKQTNKQTSNNTNKQTKQKQTNTPTLQN
jgi:hypothetical protein